MELKDTINLMTSGDPQDRLMGEYLQAKIRRDALLDKLFKYPNEHLLYKHLLYKQLNIMREYVAVLEDRFIEQRMYE